METSPHKGITISSFKRMPGGFMLLLILAVLTEWFVYSIRPILIDDFWNKFIINEHYLIDMPKDYEYLIMGNSVHKTGINPTDVSDKILNLGLPGSKPLGLYIMLKRYLRRHRPPRAIFLYVDPEPVYESFLVILRYFVNDPEFISVWNDLTWEERRVFVMRYWASLDLRQVGLVVRDRYPQNNKVFIENMKRNNGYMPSATFDKVIADDHFSKTKERCSHKLAITKRDMKYFDKFVKLAASNNIKIVFLGLILPKELHDIFEKTGFNNDYLTFIKVLKLKYPDIYFVEQPILYLENKYFGDQLHVNKNGIIIYTEYFKNQLFVPYSSLFESK